MQIYKHVKEKKKTSFCTSTSKQSKIITNTVVVAELFEYTISTIKNLQSPHTPQPLTCQQKEKIIFSRSVSPARPHWPVARK